MQTVQSVDTGTNLDGAIHYELGHIKPQTFPIMCLLWHPKLSFLCCQHLIWNLTALSKLKEKSMNLKKEKKKYISHFQHTEYSKCSLEIPILFTAL